MPDERAREYLTEEELAFLNADPAEYDTAEDAQADAEQAVENGESRPPANGEADLVPEETSGEDQPTEPQEDGAQEKVLLAKDGKHTIPYETLEAERAEVARLKAQLEAVKTGKPVTPPPDATDRFAAYRTMSAGELRELEEVADDDELELIQEYRTEKILARREANQVMSDFWARNKPVFDAEPEILPMMESLYQAELAKGTPMKGALQKVETYMGKLTGKPAPTEAAHKIAEGIQSLESKKPAPRTLANAGTNARSGRTADLDGLSVLEAEQLVGKMSKAELDAWLLK